MNKYLYFIFLIYTYCSFAQENDIYFSALDINKKEGSNIYNLNTLGDDLIFTANQTIDIQRIFKLSNNKLSFFSKDKNGVDLKNFSNTNYFILNESKFIFGAEANNKKKLFVSDGTQSNTIELTTYNNIQNNSVHFNNKIYYLDSKLNDYYNFKLHYTDGTVEGTKSLNLDLSNNIVNVKNLKLINDTLYLVGNVDDIDQLFKITSNHDIYQISDFSDKGRKIMDYEYKNGIYYYITNLISNTNTSMEFLKCEDKLCQNIFPEDKYLNLYETKFKNFNKNIIFLYPEAVNYYEKKYNFFIIDDNDIKLIETSDINLNKNYFEINQTFEFNNSWYIVATDSNKTYLYKYHNNQLLNIYTSNQIQGDVTITDNNFYYLITNDLKENQIIKSNGTIEGTKILTNTAKGTREISSIKNTIYFKKFDDVNGDELWSYNEYSNEISLVRNINFQGSGEVSGITKVGNKIFFKGNINKTYSSSNSEQSIIYHGSPEENYNYGSKEFYENNENVLLFSKGDLTSYISKLNKENNNFDLIYKGKDYDRFSIYRPQTIGNKFYFIAGILSEKGNDLQLHYVDNNTINIVKTTNGNYPDLLALNNFYGLYKLNDSYYYTTYGNNKGSIFKFNYNTNTVELVYRFNNQEYDSNPAIIIGNLNEKLVVEYNQNLYYFDGEKSDLITNGKSFNLGYIKSLTPTIQPIINNKLIYLKPTNDQYINELWSTNGINHQKLNIDIHTNTILHLTHCDNKLFFVNGNSDYLYQTDGSPSGTKSLGQMSHKQILQFDPMKCYNDKLFFVKEIYGNKISVLDNNQNKSFNIKFKELPEMKINYDFIQDIEIVDGYIYLNVQNSYGGKEVYTANYNDFNLTTLSSNEIHINPFIKDDIFDIFPIPSSNYLNIKKNNNEEILNINISNINGSKIKGFKMNNQFKEIKIDLSVFPKGTYIIQIITNKNNYSKKFIKI